MRTEKMKTSAEATITVPDKTTVSANAILSA
jgi:hypothetical protein